MNLSCWVARYYIVEKYCILPCSWLKSLTSFNFTMSTTIRYSVYWPSHWWDCSFLHIWGEWTASHQTRELQNLFYHHYLEMARALRLNCRKQMSPGPVAFECCCKHLAGAFTITGANLMMLLWDQCLVGEVLRLLCQALPLRGVLNLPGSETDYQRWKIGSIQNVLLCLCTAIIGRLQSPGHDFAASWSIWAGDELSLLKIYMLHE